MTQSSQFSIDSLADKRDLAAVRMASSTGGTHYGGNVYHALPCGAGSTRLADYLLISIPPKYALSQVIRFIKGKSAIHIARVYAGRKRNYVGQNFWARGYFASTVGRDEQVIREYIRHQEAEDRRIDQLSLM